MTDTNNNTNPRRLPKGTLVVNTNDGEGGRIIEVCTFRRNGIDAFSYAVQTAYGREVWEVGELVVPTNQSIGRASGAARQEIPMTRNIEFTGIEFTNASEALQHANADPRLDTAILLGGKHYAVAKSTAHRLETDGDSFAYVCDHQMPDGSWRIVTVPVND